MLQTLTKINNLLPLKGEFAISPIIEFSADMAGWLSKDEQEEISSFKNEKRKNEFITSRLMLKVLAQDMGMQENEFIIIKDELGRPCGKCGPAEYCVSIAHTQNDVFCGITRNTVIGVDIEPAKRTVPERLKKRIVHPNEAQWVKETEAIRLWTIKEALIKLEGQGLRINMNEVLVKRNRNDFFSEINNDKTAKICSFKKEENWLAIAYYQ